MATVEGLVPPCQSASGRDLLLGGEHVLVGVDLLFLLVVVLVLAEHHDVEGVGPGEAAGHVVEPVHDSARRHRGVDGGELVSVEHQSVGRLALE